MDSELHLIVLWEKARCKEEEILNDIAQNLEIRAAYEISWSPDIVADNFSRFYGQKLPDKSFKEQECGKGAFLLLVVSDNSPVYDYIETSRGHEYANSKIFNLKEKYRSWTGGGHKIHTTINPKETNHDAALLLGLNYDDLNKKHPLLWDGKVTSIRRNVTGAEGWKDFHELFYTLNATLDYVFMRGEKYLTQEHIDTPTSDMDLLVKDYANAQMIVGGEITFLQHKRNKNLVRVGNNKIYIDLFDEKNRYEDSSWSERVFKTRVLNKDGIYVADVENQFYMLIYHCLIHKVKAPQEHYSRLHELFCELGLDKQYELGSYESPFDLYYQLLERFMIQHGYKFCRADDDKCSFSDNIVSLRERREYIEDVVAFSDVCPVYTDSMHELNNVFFRGRDQDGNLLFIKTGHMNGLYMNEFLRSRELWKQNPQHFCKPFYYHDGNEGLGFIATAFMKGISLQHAVDKGLLSVDDKRTLIQDLDEIFVALSNSDVIHRDIHPRNLVIHEGRLYLIDFQMAVSKSHYVELEFMNKRLQLLSGLGTSLYASGRFVWDDAYSLLKSLEFIGRDEAIADLYDEVHAKISKAVGIHTVRYFRPDEYERLERKLVLYKLKSRMSLSSSSRKKYRKKVREVEDLLPMALLAKVSWT